jgi:hypothetical protein
MGINGWTKVNQKYGSVVGSEVYKKGKYFLEIFQDSSWRGHSDNANVILYDSTISSYESSFGKDVSVKYFDTRKEAKDYAIKYMKEN